MGYYYTDQTTQDLVAIMQQMLAQVGVKIEGWLIEGDTATLLNTMPGDATDDARLDPTSVSNVKWDLCYAALAATSYHNYYQRFASGELGGVANSAPRSDEIDAMVAKLMNSADVEDQKAAYAELEKWQAENLYIMPMYYQPIWLVTTDKIVDNLDLTNLGNPQFDWDMSMHEWTLK
jgi:ABC-type transport system substrate-binding protein